jgi:hypothetical protein
MNFQYEKSHPIVDPFYVSLCKATTGIFIKCKYDPSIVVCACTQENLHFLRMTFYKYTLSNNCLPSTVTGSDRQTKIPASPELIVKDNH